MDETQKDVPTDLSGILAKVMSNPEAIGMLSSLLGGMKGFPPKADAPQTPPQGCESILLPSPPCPCKGNAGENRKRLLLALKPYLSKERQAALDRILMISEALVLLRSEKRG